VSIAGNAKDVSLLRAKILFNRKNSGVYEGFRNLGSCPLFVLNTTTDEEDVLDWTQASTPPLITLIKKVVPEFSIELYESNVRNLALMFMGTVSQFTQAATAITNEVHNDVVQGTLVRLDKYGPVTTVTVEPAGGGTALTPGTDYTIEEVGKVSFIYIVPGGGIADGADIQVDYTPTAIASPGLYRIAGAAQPIIEGELMAIGQPANGGTGEVRVWRAQVRPDGDKNFISENADKFKLKLKVLTDSTKSELWQYNELAAGT
jgi:hypothetical protein